MKSTGFRPQRARGETENGKSPNKDLGRGTLHVTGYTIHQMVNKED
jgi:hypothetical protein